MYEFWGCVQVSRNVNLPSWSLQRKEKWHEGVKKKSPLHRTCIQGDSVVLEKEERLEERSRLVCLIKPEQLVRKLNFTEEAKVCDITPWCSECWGFVEKKNSTNSLNMIRKVFSNCSFPSPVLELIMQTNPKMSMWADIILFALYVLLFLNQFWIKEASALDFEQA